MGLFDTVKLKANALAADVERAGKITAAQARTVVLQNEIRKAERELGHSAFSLIESGEVGHPDLEAAAARLREACLALKDKEAEITGLRRAAEAGDEAAPASTPEAPGLAPDSAAAPESAVAAIAAEPAAAETPSEAAAGSARKPATKHRAPAAKKPAPKKVATTKRAAKKPSADKKPSAAGRPSDPGV